MNVRNMNLVIIGIFADDAVMLNLFFYPNLLGKKV